MAYGPADAAESAALDFAGHLKYQFRYQYLPDDSVLRSAFGSDTTAHNLETRLRLGARRDSWDLDVHYQFIAIHTEALGLALDLPGQTLPVNRLISDDRRWWNLTYSNDHGDDSAIAHRLDRLSVGYTSERTVWRFGRQAITWGNGLLFTPMDIFNPFDPAAVDKEYKTGDDMLYGQYLFGGGSDLQGVAVVRRDPASGQVERDQSSLALKYHGFVGTNEYDLLAAEHFDDGILGLGGSVDVGGAVWRGDLTRTDTGIDAVWSAVTSVSYSWNWFDRNVSGVLEYYYNGFGQRDGRYSPGELLDNPELLERIGRGELFTLARHYAGAAMTVEVTPLLLVTPNLFVNLTDPSALAQLVVQYDWQQNVLLLAALNIPVGPPGSEYGGIETPVEGRYFSTGASLFAQLAWYF
jgi:hypothetical protein